MAQGFGLGQPYSDGESFQQVVAGASPAAGANFQLKPDARWIHRLVACSFTFVADANAANRQLTLEYKDAAGAAFCVDGRALVVTANLTRRFNGSIARGSGEDAANADAYFVLTPVFLIPGHTLNIIASAIQAGDQLSAIQFLFDRFPTGKAEEPYVSE